MADTERRITAKMVLDSTGFNSSLKGVNAELKNAQSQMKLASQGIKSFGSDSNRLKDVQSALSKQVELHAKKVDIYRQSMEKAKTKMQENIRKRDELKTSLDSANRKYDEAVRIYGRESTEARRAKDEVDRLKSEHEKASKAVETNAKQVQNHERNLNNANAQMVRTQGELRRVNEELSRGNNRWVQASEGLKKHSEKLKNVGGAVSGVGDKILKLSAPLAATGLASLKFSTEFEDSIAKVSTIADTTQVPINKLRKDILKLSDDTGIASSEIANNVYDAISAGQKTGDAVNFVRNSTKLAKAGFAEAGQSLDLLTTIMNAYGMEAKEVTTVSDVLINTQNLGKTTVGELSSSMGKVIPTAKAFGVNLQQVASGYAIMTAKGIKAAETTTYQASMFNELGKSGTKASDAVKKVSGKSFPELMKSGKSVGDVLAMMNDYAKKNNLSLADLFGSAEAGKAALILSADAGKDFNEMLKSMNNTAGKTDEAFKKVSNTTGERFKKSMNQLKNNGIKLGDSLAPIMDKLSNAIAKIADKLSGLSKEQLDSIVKWGMLSMATGGALKVVGGGITTVGNIAGALSKLTGILGSATTATSAVGGAASVAGGAGGFAGLAASVGGAILPFAPFIAGAAAVGVAAYGIHKHMSQETIPTVDLFADKMVQTTEKTNMAVGGMATAVKTSTITISEETKKAVGSYVEMDKGVSDTLNNLYVNSTTITEKNANELIGKYNNMTDTIKNGYDKHYQERSTMLNEFFANNKSLTEKEKAEILQKEKNHNDSMKASTEEYNHKIMDILNRASKEKRQLTADEVKDINQFQENMRKNAVQSLSKEETESKVIMERLKDFGTRVTAEQASNVIKNAEEQRQKSVDKANRQYIETKQKIEYMRDVTGTITKEQADKLIAEAERQKEGTKNKAEQMKTAVIEKIKAQNSQVLKDVDTSSGNILTKWGKLKQWWDNWHPIKKIFGAETQTNGAEHRWTGDTYFKGGLTYLHDAPGKNSNYELYDLPRGTRIFNHDASVDLVTKTAENVATKVANSVLKNFEGLGTKGQEQTIIVPVQLDGREIARLTARPMSEELSRLNRGGGLSFA